MSDELTEAVARAIVTTGHNSKTVWPIARRAIAAVRAHDAAQGLRLVKGDAWQSIDTAPRDGTQFLGCCVSADNYTGDWHALVEYSGDPDWPWEDYEGKHPAEFLTHWQPLSWPTPLYKAETND